jgi:hypothetical protein
VQPSVPAPGEPYVTAANGTEFLMEARKPWDNSNKIRIWAISNTNNILSNPASLRGRGVDISVESYAQTVNATQPNVVGPYCSSKGATSAPSLDGLFAAFQATIQKANGKLYGAVPFGTKDSNGLLRDAIAWFAIKPSVRNTTGVPSASIANQGYVIPPSGYSLLNPAFGVQKSGAGILGFSITNQSESVIGGFLSTGFVAFTGTAVSGNITVTGEGVASDDGFTGCPGPGPGQVGRWGDYGAAAVDPVTGAIYAANENISGPPGAKTNWGTFITQVNLAP